LKLSKVDALIVKMLTAGPSTNSASRAIFACCAFALAMAGLSPFGMAQQATQAASPSAPRPARHASNAQLASPAIEVRVERLLRQMTLEEKIGQLVQYNDTGGSPAAQAAEAKPAADSGTVIVAVNPVTANHLDAMQLAATGRVGSMLNMIGAERTNTYQHLAVDRSRLHIPLLFGADVIHGYRTVYPIPLGLAASFDSELVVSLAHTAAEEATTAGVRWFYSPMVDISRDPRWGRTAEGAGEDPYLGAAMARAYIRGYQGDDLSQPGRVAASVKHFAAYGAAEAGREYNTTDMSEITLRQVYLPPYKAAVEAGAATMMSAFNSLNGVPASANPFLLGEILRGEWGFDGFVVSDYTAVMELMNHGIALDPATATRKAITAGVDVDMMSHFYDTQLPELISTGKVPIAVVDEAVRRVLRVKFATGLFEHPYAEGTEVTSAVDAHRPLVRKGAEESFVLLQKQQWRGARRLCRFRRSAKELRSLARLPTTREKWWAHGVEREANPDIVTIRQALTGARAEDQRNSALRQRNGNRRSLTGRIRRGRESSAGCRRCLMLALGESNEMSGEAGSRAYLDLPGNQEQLLEAVGGHGKACCSAGVLRPSACPGLGSQTCRPQSWKSGSPAPRPATPLPTFSMAM
jgi:beta-glucosidase